MFYAHFVLAKKGPLARIWLAAHWDKKLTKAHVFETNIEKSVEGILQPKVKMALRTSGHLLLGVVRIYSRKAKYLLADCNEAFVKIKMAFRPGMVDLPEENREAAVNAITLPEVFHDFDTEMPDLADVDIQAQFSMNQTRAEEITMREDYGNINLDTGDNDGFGDMPGMSESADGPDELVRSGSLRESLQAEGSSTLFTDDHPSSSKAGPSSMSIDAPHHSDGFGGDDFGGGGGGGGGGLFEGGLFDEPAAPTMDPSSSQPRKKTPRAVHSDDSDDDDHHMDDFGGAPSPGGMSSPGGSRPSSPTAEVPPAMDETPLLANKTAQEHTTLLHNENETFALAPVDASAMRGFVRTKRKRKLIVDEVKAIAGEEMKAQLSDTGDIVTTLDLAPPTKRLMHWKETGGVEKLFSLPGRSLHSQAIFKGYQTHLTSTAGDDEVFGLLGDTEKDTIQLDHVPGGGDVDGEESAVPKRGPGRPPKRKTDEQPTPPKKTPRKEAREAREAAAAAALAAAHAHGSDVSLHQQRADEMSALAAQQRGFDQFQAHQTPAQRSLFGDSQHPEFIQQQHHDNSGQLENIGYDPSNPNIENMGWDDGAQGAPTPGAMSMGAPTPFHEDEEYEGYNPASVGNANKEDEEMQENETIEQFEDRVLNKRAAHLNTILRSKFEGGQADLVFSELPIRRMRKAMAQNFYSLLVLQKVMAVELDQQDDRFVGEIHIRKGPNFETAVL